MGSIDASSSSLIDNVDNGQRFNPLDLEQLKRQCHKTIDFVLDYYKSIESYPVLPTVEPGYLRRLLPSKAPCHPEPFDSVLKEITSVVLPGMTHWASPNFFAYFPATISSAALSADLLSTALNPVGFNWLASPAATELEMLTVDWLADILHLPHCFHFSGEGSIGGGVVQATTSEAILCTLVAARDSTLGLHVGSELNKLTVYASDQTHSTFAKACKIAGFSPTSIRLIKTHHHHDFSLTPSSLREAMEADVAAGFIPTYLCATVGTTSSTAVDPLGPLADVAREYGVWIHVDAAYAGSACICPEFRHHLDGVEKVDSVSVSPHKWLLTCLDCCCLWVKDRDRLVESLAIDPEYLKNRATETGSVVDYKDWQVGVGRRFRSMKLYLVVRTYGVGNLQSHIRSDVRLAITFEGMVRSDPRFQVVVPRRFGLVCFRLVVNVNLIADDAAKRRRRTTNVIIGEEEEEEIVLHGLNRKLLEKINEGGKVYMTHTVLGGIYVLRFAVGSTLTEERHVAAAWKLVTEKADELLLLSDVGVKSPPPHPRINQHSGGEEFHLGEEVEEEIGNSL